MGTFNTWMLLAGVLLLIGIVSSKFSARLGVPMLVMFLAVGMLAGSEVIGRNPFEDDPLANNLSSAALALILFDGGLCTSLTSVQTVWRQALSLSTVGVLPTSVITGLAASWVLDLPLLQGMLLGRIVGSTDAATVFSVLRTWGLQSPERLTATLEVESGSNDSMAIFLTIGLIGVILGNAGSAAELLRLFLAQFGVGALVGVGAGRLAVLAVNRIDLDYPGLYPLLALAFGLGLLIALVLILMARPIAVLVAASPFGCRPRELVLRHRLVVIPRGTTALMPGDHVFVALRSSMKPLMD